MLFRLLLLLFLLASACQRETPAPTAPPRPAPSPEMQALLHQAAGALDRQAYAVGLALADSATARAPFQPDAHFVQGRLRFAMGQLDEARAAYRKALDLDPTYEGAWHNLGNVAYRQGRYYEALRHYRREAEQHPAPNPWHGMGGTYEALGQADSARWAYEQALAADAAYAPAYASLAAWHQASGDYETALGYARQALQHAPDNPTYQSTVGLLLFRTGDYPSAIARLEPVVRTQPWNYSAWFNLGQALQRLGRTDDARRVLQHADSLRAKQADVDRFGRIARRAPTDLQAQLTYANALRQTGRLRDALDAYHVALALRPSNLALQNNIATLYAQQGDTTEALARYRRILAADSTYAEAWLNLGIHYARQGNRPGAKAAWERAFTYGTDNPTVQAFRSQLQR